MSVVVSIAFSISFGCWLAPRMFTYADRKLARAHLQPHQQASTTTPHQSALRKISRIRVTKQQENPVSTLSAVDIVEEMARHTRAGIHPRDVIVLPIEQCLSQQHRQEISPALSGAPIEEILQQCLAMCDKNQSQETHLMFQLLQSTYVNGIFVPAALDHVVTTLRTHQSLRAELRTATTQALLTARVLTFLPLVACISLLLFSSDTRERLFHFSTMFFLGVGISLNRVGALWIRKIIHRVESQPLDEIALLSEHLVSSLRAGCSMSESLQRWNGVTWAGTNVANAVNSGAPLEVALRQLPSSTAAYRLAHAIESAYKDGLPLVNTMHRMVDDARNSMRHHSEVLIRQLPTRLSFPLVLCILPSFLFITVMPLMMNTLGQLAPTLSPSITVVS